MFINYHTDQTDPTFFVTLTNFAKKISFSISMNTLHEMTSLVT